MHTALKSRPVGMLTMTKPTAVRPEQRNQINHLYFELCTTIVGIAAIMDLTPRQVRRVVNKERDIRYPDWRETIPKKTPKVVSSPTSPSESVASSKPDDGWVVTPRAPFSDPPIPSYFRKIGYTPPKPKD